MKTGKVTAQDESNRNRWGLERELEDASKLGERVEGMIQVLALASCTPPLPAFILLSMNPRPQKPECVCLLERAYVSSGSRMVAGASYMWKNQVKWLTQKWMAVDVEWHFVGHLG